MVATWRRLRGRKSDAPPDLLTPEDFDAAEPGRGRERRGPLRLLDVRGDRVVQAAEVDEEALFVGAANREQRPRRAARRR